MGVFFWFFLLWLSQSTPPIAIRVCRHLLGDRLCYEGDAIEERSKYAGVFIYRKGNGALCYRERRSRSKPEYAASIFQAEMCLCYEGDAIEEQSKYAGVSFSARERCYVLPRAPNEKQTLVCRPFLQRMSCATMGAIGWVCDLWELGACPRRSVVTSCREAFCMLIVWAFSAGHKSEKG